MGLLVNSLLMLKALKIIKFRVQGLASFQATVAVFARNNSILRFRV